MFGFKSKKQIYSLVYVYGLWFNCSYLNPQNYPEGSFVVVDIKGTKHGGRILENTTERPANTEGVQFKEITRLLEPEDRAAGIKWFAVFDKYYLSIGKTAKMRPDIQKKYDCLIADLDNAIKKKNERDKEKVTAIVQYLKGEIKLKKDLGAIVDHSDSNTFFAKESEISNYLTDEERELIRDKIHLCDSRYQILHCIYERIDAKSRTIKEPNEDQAKYQDKKIEEAILTLVKR